MLFSLSEDHKHVCWLVVLPSGAGDLPLSCGPDNWSCHRLLWPAYAELAHTAGASACLSLPLLSDASEQVRYGLEVPESGTYQRRVGHMRLLGEMYNFRLVDSK